MSKNGFNNNWRKEISPYEKPRLKSSVWQLTNTLLPYVLLWYLGYLSLNYSYWLSLLFLIPAGGFLVRIFIIFHDCCHKSFFSNRVANDVVGTITGILTFCPYMKWRHSHSVHHATNGNLDKRGTGDIWTLTVQEYVDSNIKKKLSYRMYRNPFIMFVLGPVYIFLIDYRFNRKKASSKEIINTYITNVGIVGLIASLCFLIGWKEYLMVQVPIFLVSGMAGVWLFYIQHTFEDGYFEWNEEWSYAHAAMEGSSYYKLPKVLQWFTGNIGYHHIHHLSPRVPNYSLEEVHNKNVELQKVPTITLRTSLNSLKFHLWDEELKKFIRFKDLKKHRQL